jgi:hypothetical protein
MFIQRIAAALLGMVCLSAPVTAAMYKIENPASTINNPADKITNPAVRTNNPASNIYNPGEAMGNPSPLSPPTKPVPAPKVVEAAPETKLDKQIKSQPEPKVAAVPLKNYHFRTVDAYLTAAKKAFIQDDYLGFVSITEDALRRIAAGTLKASPKSKQQLLKYRDFGHGLLGNGAK